MTTCTYSHNYINRIALTLLLTLFSVLQSNSTILNIRNGLSSSLVNDIRQSSDGHVWIATEDGLSCYDGAKCENYYHIQGDTTSLIGNYIRQTYETHDGRILIGALHGLQLYNRDTDTFTNIPMRLANGEIVMAYITGIVELSNGLIYIATSGHGLFKMTADQHEAQQMDGFTGYYIGSIMADSSDNVWISTADRGNSRISNNGFVYIVNTENNANITSFCETPEGEIYAASNIGEIMRYNPSTDKLETISQPTGLNIKIIYPYNQLILIGTDGNGLKALDTKTLSITNYDMGVLPFDTNKTKVHTLMVDKWGSLWIGLFQCGVVIKQPTTSKFNYIGSHSTLRNIIGSNYVSQLLYTSNGTLYVGTDNDGIYAINTNTWETRHYDKPATIMSLASDNNGRIYIGTYTEGLWYIEQKNGAINHTTLIQRPDGTAPSINGIVPDNKGNIYIGTMGEGLYRYTTASNTLKHYPDCSGLKYNYKHNQLHNRWVSCLCLIDNKLYFGTQDGIGCLDISTDDFVCTMGVNRILADYTIIDITADRYGFIWAATNKGLIRIKQNTTQVKPFNLSNIVAHENFKALICDHIGNIWVTTSHELIHINAKTLNTTTYYEQDGIMTSEFAKRSATITPTDHIFFGGNDGITHFNTNEVSPRNQRPTIKVSDFYINGRRVLPSTTSDGMIVRSTDNLHFDLAHTDNSFTIELTTLQFIPSPHMSYQYSINNEPLIETGNGINRISIHNIDPGEYNIKFIGNNNGNLSDPITITVCIHPAWWATWWMKTICLLLIITTIIFIIKQNINRQRTKTQLIQTLHRQEVHDAKMQLFTDIAHEIRTPMSLVISPLNELMATDADPHRNQNYDIINRNAQRILRLMTQILDIQKIDSGKMTLHFSPAIVSRIITEVCNTFGFEARAKNITLQTETQTVDNTLLQVDTQHFDKILTNLISNAIKYTPENGTVIVRAYIGQSSDIEGDNYIIEVEDSGNGFTTDEANHLFDRFHRLQSAIDSDTIGFGVGLDLTRTLVELHHGTIKALNCTQHTGGLMRICLPYTPIEADNNTTNNTDIQPYADNASPNSRPRYNILFVDDDEEMCKYVRKILREKNFNIITCNNGKEAIEKLLETEINIVITDVVMPIMDGFTLCKNIKNNINICHIPVIILTSRSADTDRIESYENGADAYIAKPFNTEVLIASIRNLISRHEKLKAGDVAKDVVMGLSTPNEPSVDEKLLAKVTEYINKNIANPDYSIEDLASDVGISRVHLHRRMRDLTGLTTRDFVRNVRMEYAAKLLRNGKYEVNEVAIMTGFSTTSYFSQAFKAHFGISPTSYTRTTSE